MTRPSADAGASDAEIIQLIQAFIGAQTGETPPEIVRLHRASLGKSRENWSLDAVWGGDASGPEPLIVRRDPEGGLVDTDRELEFNLLRALEPSGLPVPKVRWLDATGEWLGRPSLVMRRLAGESDYFVVNNDHLPLATRVSLAERFCDLLAAVHLVPWAQLGLGEILPDPGPGAAEAELARFEQVLRTDELRRYDEIEAILAWLRDHAPRSEPTVLVHADFKPGNVLLADGEITALLDWELAHLGDRHEDLGWVTQPLREREHLIAGAWERDQLLQRYADATGFDVDEDALHWWQTFATFRTLVMQVSGLRAYVEDRSDKAYRPTQKVLSTGMRQITKGSAA
ncbi:phosphotransferase family protein [Baekduia soli]|uniref:Phosphotransferase family protein n=1 Tax=Baekduia soli TaxID=496014 RepID=A0A5B8U5A7_9ACTN|nr:phosphotransferase family protein [Baekduia soli]QEC48309.1 phosphotransferase family protein [Baekduia soli]